MFFSLKSARLFRPLGFPTPHPFASARCGKVLVLQGKVLVTHIFLLLTRFRIVFISYRKYRMKHKPSMYHSVNHKLTRLSDSYASKAFSRTGTRKNVVSTENYRSSLVCWPLKVLLFLVSKISMKSGINGEIFATELSHSVNHNLTSLPASYVPKLLVPVQETVLVCLWKFSYFFSSFLKFCSPFLFLGGKLRCFPFFCTPTVWKPSNVRYSLCF